MGWLVLHRSAGESIMIGDTEVSIKEVRRGRATIGINAPNDVRVMRKELLTREVADLDRARAALEESKERPE